MRTITMLKESALEEAHSSNEYAMCALEYKVSDPELSRFFHELSEIELDHCMRFLTHFSRRVEELKSSGLQFDEKFENDVADCIRGIMIARSEAKRLVGMYR